MWKFPLAFPQQAAALSITHLFALAIGAFLLGARSRFFRGFVDLCCADCFVERLDYLLGSDRLVRCSWGLYLVSLGMVGGGTCAESTKIKMAISLARTVCLPARHRRFSLHGFNAAGFDCMALYQISSRNSQRFLDSADAPWRRPWFRPFRARMAGAS